MTSSFEDQLAWCATQMSKSAAAELMHVSWRTVSSACGRVWDDMLAREGGSLLGGLRRIGVDETSRTGGAPNTTVVVDHDTGRVVWCADGHGRAVLSRFLDELGEEGRAALEVVTADGVRWVADMVAKRRPNADRVMDPFHVVQRATDALDRLRRQAWNALRRGPSADPAAARAVKGSRFALLKNPGDLTSRQSGALASVRAAGGALWRGYLLKEGLRAVFRAASATEARGLLDRWLSWACRRRIPKFIEVSRRVRRRRDTIVRAVALRVSNARVEATNDKVKLAVRTAYGFRNVGNLLAMVMLRCPRLAPSLPGRG